jgi:tRNA-(ms[2]io[6]A)-hydroxylase
VSAVAAPSEFVACPTPAAWLRAAVADIDTLLVDHAHCERKAASTALAMIHRYPDDPELLDRLSRLAREELRHFEQVLKVMHARGIAYRRMTPSRYAEALHALVRTGAAERRLDQMVLGAFIEARSCERFEALVPVLPADLADFYRGLCAAESRHYAGYLVLAARCAKPAEVAARVAVFRVRESELITAADAQLRFHSGPPSN